MNIIYLTMQFPVPSETFASLDVESLGDQGHHVAVYGMRPKHKQFEKMIKERRHENITIKHFSMISVVTFLLFIARHPKMSFSLMKWIILSNSKKPKHLFKSLLLFPSSISIFKNLLKIKPDVVHLFWGHYPSMVGYLVNKYMPKTVLSMFLGAHDLVTGYPGSSDLSFDCDVIFTHSRSNLPMISKMGIDASKVNVIVRGTKLDFPVESTLNKFDYLHEPRFLTASRLIKEKGVDYVIEAFKNILSEFPGAILYVAGDGPYRSNLVELVKFSKLQENVIFLGHISQIDLVEYMAKVHFFLLLSRYPSERLPNVVKEAMFQKCVVLTTNTSGIDELIQDGNDGFIVEQSKVLARIQECVLDPIKSKDIAEQAYLKIINKFDVNVSMKTYLTIWGDALNRKHL